jgi:hypothetical protein
MPKNWDDLISDGNTLGLTTGVNLITNLGDRHTPALLQTYAINDTFMKQLQDAGVSYIRIFCEWGEVERIDGVFDFAPLQGAIRKLKQYGIDTYVRLYFNNTTNAGFTPTLDAGNNVEQLILDIRNRETSRVRRYVREAYKALGSCGVQMFGAFNEPDLAGNFGGFELNTDGTVSTTPLISTTKPRYIDEFFCMLREEMNYVNSTTTYNLKLGGVALTSWSTSVWGLLCQYGFLNYIDFLDNHYYARTSARAYNPLNVFRQHKLMVDTARLYSNGRTIPILIGEFGNANRDSTAGADRVTSTIWDLQTPIAHACFSKMYPDFPIVRNTFFDGIGTNPSLYNNSYSSPSKGSNDTGYEWFQPLDSVDNAPAQQTFVPTHKCEAYKRHFLPFTGLEVDRFVVMAESGRQLFDSANPVANTSTALSIGIRGNVQTFTFNGTASPMGMSGTLVLTLNGTAYNIALTVGDTTNQVVAKMQAQLGNVARVALESGKYVIRPVTTDLSTLTATSTTEALLETVGATSVNVSTNATVATLGSVQWLYDIMDAVTYTEGTYTVYNGTNTGTGGTATALNKQFKEPLNSSIWYVFCKDRKRGNKLSVLVFRFSRIFYYAIPAGGTLQDFSALPIADRKEYAFKRAVLSQSQLQALYPTKTFTGGIDMKAFSQPQRVDLEV